MSKEEADIELKAIRNKLDRIDKLRAKLAKAEHALCVRQQTLMFEFYPEIINAKIDHVLKIRRARREGLSWTSKRAE